jgi:RNA polymerase sigma-70 factor (ECF subfamily)
MGGAVMTDWQNVLEKALDGDAEAFGELYQGYLRPKMLQWAGKILKNEDDAEDIVQEVFLYLFEKNRYITIQIPSLDSFTSYMFKTTEHKCLDVRKKGRLVRYSITEETITRLQYEHVSEDVLQGVKNIQQELSKPVGREKFETLLKAELGDKLTKNLKFLLLKYCRQEDSRQTSLEKVGKPPHVKPDPLEVKQEVVDNRLKEVLHTLSDEEKELIHERFYVEKSLREIAEEQEIPISTLQSRLERIFDKLSIDVQFYTLWREYLESKKEIDDYEIRRANNGRR